MSPVDSVLRTMIHIQASLDSDLSLSSLSSLAARSPCHFQRVFAAATGETPKRYVTRLRLERAAFRIILHDVGLLQIALDCGFQNHETFTRAFRQHFGVTPSQYRCARASEPKPVGQRPSAPATTGYRLSDVTVRNLRPAHLAFVRHIGPYADVTQSLFDHLEAWAKRKGLTTPAIWMGLGHDAPSTTPAARQRFDAALVVPERFDPAGAVGYQPFAGGLHAIATHVGPYATLGLAYADLLPRLLALRGYRLIGLPLLEIYQTSEMRTANPLNTTEVCFPVEPI